MYVAVMVVTVEVARNLCIQAETLWRGTFILLCEGFWQYLGCHGASSFIPLPQRYFYYKTRKIYIHSFIMPLNFNCSSVLHFNPYNMDEVSVLYTIQFWIQLVTTYLRSFEESQNVQDWKSRELCCKDWKIMIWVDDGNDVYRTVVQLKQNQQ